jgi:hypothetical protein
MEGISPIEAHILGKLSSDDIKTIRVAKYACLTIAAVICSIVISFGAEENIVDRFQTGHAIVTTKTVTTTEQTVNYPEKK